MRKGGPREANLIKMITTGGWQSQDLNSEHPNSKASFMLCFSWKRSQNYSLESFCLHRIGIKVLPLSPACSSFFLLFLWRGLGQQLHFFRSCHQYSRQKLYKVTSAQNAIRILLLSKSSGQQAL